MIQEVLTCAAKGRKLARGNKLILDTTCVPLDILYPTDIRLLERCRQAILGLMTEAKRLGMKVADRTYKRIARKMFVTFSKLSKPKEKTRRRVHKGMYQFVRRNFKQLVALREAAGRLLGPRCPTDPPLRRFLRKMKETEIKVRAILHQQLQVRRGQVHIHDRIVSFHRAHVRPIVRGKLPVSCEFGPKILVAVVRGRLQPCMWWMRFGIMRRMPPWRYRESDGSKMFSGDCPMSVWAIGDFMRSGGCGR